MKDLVHGAVVKLVKMTAKNKAAFYILAAVLIPICAAIQLCSDHLPELWRDVKDNFATLEDQRQYVLDHPDTK